VVSSNPVRRIAAAVFLVVLLSTATPAFAGEELVLIVSTRSDVDQLDSPLVRKLFLGLTVTQHGNRLRPVLNEADPEIKELFLQNIVSMSDSTYDRYVLRLSLLQGRTQPTVFRSNAELINAVAADPTSVGYVWARDVAHDPRIKILRVVWHD
jgi:ABC-type phosphate transport system substrate-binding protein